MVWQRYRAAVRTATLFGDILFGDGFLKIRRENLFTPIGGTF